MAVNTVNRFSSAPSQETETHARLREDACGAGWGRGGFLRETEAVSWMGFVFSLLPLK